MARREIERSQRIADPEPGPLACQATEHSARPSLHRLAATPPLAWRPPSRRAARPDAGAPGARSQIRADTARCSSSLAARNCSVPADRCQAGPPLTARPSRRDFPGEAKSESTNPAERGSSRSRYGRARDKRGAHRMPDCGCFPRTAANRVARLMALSAWPQTRASIHDELAPSSRSR